METHTENSSYQQPALYASRDITANGKFSKSHFYNLVARGLFPKPCIVMGPRFTRWSAKDVDQWFADPAKWISERTKVEGSEVAV